MCGLAGIVNTDASPVDEAVLRRMTTAIAHRGPDGEGHYVAGPVGLGHRRLAIIDLSLAGAQPMANETGSLRLIFNGEIYNFRELRRELEALGHIFRSRTDCEVVLHAYEEWGESAVGRFNGMFAFALWDEPNRRIWLARDRYGIKPLYYTQQGRAFLFGSEIKALLKHPALSPRPSFDALSEYFTFQNIFTDLTLFEGVKLLPAGCTMIVPLDGAEPRLQRFWDYRFDSRGVTLSEDETAECLYDLFDQAVTRQLVADVPVGAYLSGGMDSGSIVAVASRQIPRIHTFTGGFDLSSASGLELGFDERPASERLANRFKTEHYETVLHAGDMEHVLPELIWHLEDLRVGQCYPNYYVARLASRFVHVVLSGAGGDELFAGYPWRYYRGIEGASSDRYYDAYYEYWQRLIPDQDRQRFFSADAWSRVRHHEPREVFRGVFGRDQPPPADVEEVVNYSLYFEARTFLHGLFLVEDKLSMAHGLETRVPFLDNDLVDFALRIPPKYKLHDLVHAPQVDEDEVGKRRRYQSQPAADGKIVLRQAMRRLVPRETADGRKQGFSAPDASWFKGESIDYVNALLRDRRARLFDYLDADYVTRVLDEHSSGRVNHRLLIWSLLSFEWWCRTFLA
jgi:asparagine synthase (glutamine-hydrolysing)